MPRIELYPTTPDSLVTLGPTIGIQVGFDPDYEPGRGDPPALPPDEYPALIDTGAVESCIDVTLASALGLAVVDRVWASGVFGPTEANTYLAQVFIPALNHTLIGEFAGVHLLEGGQVHVALIGRTFLRHHRLVYDGRSGEVTLESD